MKRKRALSIFVLALLSLALATSIYLQYFPHSQPRYASAVEVQGSLGVYWEENCTQKTYSIGWGALSPGKTNRVTVYARNEGNETVLLAVTAQNWNPQNASSLMSFSWSCQDHMITKGKTVKVELALSLAPSSKPGFSTFGVNLVFHGTPSLAYLLHVASAHDSPSPGVGDSLYSDGSSVTCNVTSPVVEDGVSYTCIGWSGTGSVPSSGSRTSATFTITQNSTITWNWAVTQRTLTISSAHDSPIPSVGAHTYNDDSSVTCSVTSPVTEDSTVWTCTGWSGTGSVPSSGSSKTVTFTISQNSTITWNWQAQVVERRLTVNSAHDSPVPGNGDSFWNDGQSVTCSVSSPATEDGTVWTCTGWSGAGSAPSTGSGTSVTFTITQDSTITWNWQEARGVRAFAVTVDGIGVYWDSGCSDVVTSLDWGVMTLGEARNVVVYVRNEGDYTTNLVITQRNLNPQNASNYVNFSWNPRVWALQKQEVANVTLTLRVSQSATGIGELSFEVLFEAHTIDLDRDGLVNMKDIAFVAHRLLLTQDSPSWNPAADLNDDGRVDLKDISVIAHAFGAAL